MFVVWSGKGEQDGPTRGQIQGQEGRTDKRLRKDWKTWRTDSWTRGTDWWTRRTDRQGKKEKAGRLEGQTDKRRRKHLETWGTDSGTRGTDWVCPSSLPVFPLSLVSLSLLSPSLSLKSPSLSSFSCQSFPLVPESVLRSVRLGLPSLTKPQTQPHTDILTQTHILTQTLTHTHTDRQSLRSCNMCSKSDPDIRVTGMQCEPPFLPGQQPRPWTCPDTSHPGTAEGGSRRGEVRGKHPRPCPADMG